jgi:hypothetical protein
MVAGLSWVLAPEKFDRNIAEEVFNDNKEYIVMVSEFLSGLDFIALDYSGIHIDKSDAEKRIMFTGIEKRYVNIENDDVWKAIFILFGRGFRSIGRSDNTIYFEKWYRKEEERGICYTIFGDENPTLQYLTHFEKLSATGWYYYEEDYGEYRQKRTESINP